MHHNAVSKILPYAPEQLFEMVGGVMRYPEFVPWVHGMRTWNSATPAPGVTQVDAEAEVRFAVVRERFATRVRRDADARKIEVKLLYGPFKALNNVWTFAAHPDGTRIGFTLDYAFKSRLLDALLAANAQRAAEKIMACFEARARALYGEASPKETANG
ncbi:MAG: type II toxin-antitoxin system RatA family toxin [Caulobacteraceae bacterium]